MRQFFKFFFASLLAITIFSFIAFLAIITWISVIASSDKVETGSRAVLVIDLGKTFPEQEVENPFAKFSQDDNYSTPGVYDVARLIRYAKSDSSIKGIYLKSENNANGFGTSEEIRNALADFKTSKKFVYAYGDVISQRAYYISNLADKVYCNPKGALEWKGLAIQYMFFKNTLDRLEIKPQIFYAGKFKSATEPFRETQMTPANRIQSMELLNDINQQLLTTTSSARKIDTATLQQYANELSVRYATDAERLSLIDGVRYDDQVKDEIRQKLGLGQTATINFVDIGKYAQAVSFRKGSGSDRVAVIYAQGDIVDGKGQDGQIGGDKYVELVRKARFDKDVKAIVVRVNSGGGSALASEMIWRELTVAKKEKPVVMSFGDVAASGGYYLACNADSIFAQPNTITGSIGVFAIVPDLSGMFRDKLGITFDGVKTAEHADAPSAFRSLTPQEKIFFQSDVDSIYHTFLSRVASGRRKTVAEIDSIAQGRVWTGTRALQLGLVDRLGNIQDAVDCAARMAKLQKFRVKEFPEPTSVFQRFFNRFQGESTSAALQKELGADTYNVYRNLKKYQEMTGVAQARLPFDIMFQ
jgi:protease IV